MITLTHASTTIELPDQLVWLDEFDWQPVQHDVEYSLTGALLVDVGVRQAGRPITLEGWDDRAWITRDVVQQLNALAALPAITMQLALRGDFFQVAWDHARTAIEARATESWPDAQPSDPYVVQLRFLTV